MRSGVGKLGELKGHATIYWTGVAMTELAEETVLKSLEWYNKAINSGGSIKDNIFCVYELKCSSDAVGNDVDTAWKRPKGFAHMLLLGAGCNPVREPLYTQSVNSCTDLFRGRMRVRKSRRPKSC